MAGDANGSSPVTPSPMATASSRKRNWPSWPERASGSIRPSGSGCRRRMPTDGLGLISTWPATARRSAERTPQRQAVRSRLTRCSQIWAGRSQRPSWSACGGRSRRLRRFQKGLAQAFAWPVEQVAALSDETIACRCEAVTVGDIRGCRSCAARPARGQSGQGDHALRHGPVPGAFLRSGPAGDRGRSLRSANRGSRVDCACRRR